MTDPASRRSLLVWFVRAGVTALGAAAAALAGAVALPRASSRPARWVRAARFSDLDPGVPTAITLTAVRDDGWHRARKPRVVFLMATEAGEVRALSATCTHLGCRVSWKAEADRFECPCHQGAYDREGRVIAGPPPAPLPPIAARVDLAADDIHVEI